MTEIQTETATETTTVISSDPPSDSLPGFDDPATWIVFVLALIVGIFLGQALSFWKW